MSDPQPQQPESPPAPMVLAAAEAALIGLYMGAESFLLGQITRILRGMGSGPLAQIAARASIRRVTSGAVQQLTARTGDLVRQVVGGAWGAGGAGGDGGGPHGGFLPPDENPGFDPYQLHGVRAANAIRQDLDSELADVRFRLTRLDQDIFKVIAPAGAAGQVLPIGRTSQQAQALAWREFVSRGITGFTDKSGRRWALSSYVEMAVRTASQRAYNASRLQVLQYQGINLCFVSDTGHPCPLCFPWQGVLLCITDDGEHPTVADATAAGLWHPNCRHTLSAYFPGRTTLPEIQPWTEQHALAYTATQKQRALEREIRNAKRELEYATTPEAAQAARKAVRDAQANMRQFLADNPDLNLLRQSRREQRNLANDHLNALPYDAAMR